MQKNKLAFIESLTGTLCSIPVSIIFPLLVYFKLYWNELSLCKIFFYIIIIILSTILCIGLTIINIYSLTI